MNVNWGRGGSFAAGDWRKETMSTLRPELGDARPGQYAPKNGTAYLMIYNAVKSKKNGLVHGRLHRNGESCAIGSFFDVNERLALPNDLINEIAAVNDSVPGATLKQRRNMVMRWLRWRLGELGMPVFVHKRAKRPR